MKQTRKEQFRTRKFAYGDTKALLYAQDNPQLPRSSQLAIAFEDGYKAAMRDLRKMVAEVDAQAFSTGTPQARAHWITYKIRRFLLPIR